MIIDLFAGPGGWDEGLRMIGRSDVLGIEWDKAACETARAAGHHRLQADVADVALPSMRALRAEGLIASPPCQAWSMAGKRKGELDRQNCHRLADRMAAGDDSTDWTDWEDPRSPLVCQPVRWARELLPEWIALEEVPAVAGLWEHFARIFREWEYGVWTGDLLAADYGVPQTRLRRILMARKDATVHPPLPTHSVDPQGADLFGGSTRRWVSMAEALGWEDRDRIRPARGEGLIERHGKRPDHLASEPAPTIISKSRSWERITTEESPEAASRGQWQVKEGERPPVYINGNQPNAGRRSADEPAPTVLFGHRSNDVRWAYDHPSTTIVGSSCPDVTAAPGSVRVTVQEASILQSFPAEYPWCGSRSKQYEQVGNAVPPLLAAHVLDALGVGKLRRAAA